MYIQQYPADGVQLCTMTNGVLRRQSRDEEKNTEPLIQDYILY